MAPTLQELFPIDYNLYPIDKKQLYSANKSKSRYINEQTHLLYVINFILTCLYFLFLVYFLYYSYPTIINSNKVITKCIAVFFLIIYPWVIYPIQYYVVKIFNLVLNSIFSNVYKINTW